MRLLWVLVVVCVGGLVRQSQGQDVRTAPKPFALEPLNLGEWNYNTGWTFTLYAYSAYCSNDAIENWSCSYCQMNSTVENFNTTKIFDKYGEVIYVGYNPDYRQIIVSFRGSSDIRNWISNLNFVKEDYPYCAGCEVHKGFYELWKKFEDEVIDEVNTLLSYYPGSSVVTTGHSLGGALATLAGVDVLNGLKFVAPVYTWTMGSPRVGNQEFSDWYKDHTVVHNQRITNWKDIVPHLPNEVQGFLHVPQEIWEQEYPSNFIVCSETNGEDPLCSNSVRVPNSIYDHTHYMGLPQGSQYC